MSSLRGGCALRKASSKQCAIRLPRCASSWSCANSPLRCPVSWQLRQKANKNTETHTVLQNHPRDCSEERVHRRCIGKAQEGLGRFLDAGGEEDAVGRPADGVGDRLFSKLGVKVPQVAGSALQQEEETTFSLKNSHWMQAWEIPI